MVAGGDLEEVSDQGEGGLLGPEAGDEKSFVIINRVLQWRNEGMAIEADPRYVELILLEMGVQSCKGSDVMWHPPNPTDEFLLTGIARCNFLASDRVDVQFACKESAKGWLLQQLQN